MRSSAISLYPLEAHKKMGVISPRARRNWTEGLAPSASAFFAASKSPVRHASHSLIAPKQRRERVMSTQSTEIGIWWQYGSGRNDILRLRLCVNSKEYVQ